MASVDGMRFVVPVQTINARHNAHYWGQKPQMIVADTASYYEVRDADAARLSPFVRHHINMLGRYSFLTAELAGGLRPLRDPSQPDEDDSV